jgi:hypothetical protein
MIDTLSHERDVLFIQAVGNVQRSCSNPFTLGVCEHLQAGRDYPIFLLEDSCRLANPAQSLQAVTVGSIAAGIFGDGLWRSMAQAEGHPSAFSRTGPGMWRCIKPDVVEIGGDFARDSSNPPRVSWPAGVCPELVRSTYRDSGPERGKDVIGTSFAAPKVAHIAAAVHETLPAEPTLLYRALIAQSARWPAWAESLTDPQEMFQAVRHLGYGVPSRERATENNEYRVTLITRGIEELGAKQAKVYEIPIPSEIRGVADCQIRIEVTLSYSAQPRRTRRRIRGYLSTWLDWETSGRYESSEKFAMRVLLDHGYGQQHARSLIPWTMGKFQQDGRIRGTGRNYGTLQKDWALVNAYELPDMFCLAVVGHEGWIRDPDDRAKYALAVTFEAVNRDVLVYEPIRNAIRNMIEVEEQQRILQEVEAELALGV